MMPERCSCSARIHTRNVPQNWNSTAVATSLMRLFTMSVMRASTSPSSTLPSVTTSSVGSTVHPERKPVTVAPTARRYTSSALASLNRLSPSRITSRRCGGRSCLSTVVAAAASGGATMAPSATAAPQVISGTSALTTSATTTMVSATAPRARLATARQFARRSRGEASKAASKRTGATKSASANSGSSTSVGTPGMRASAAPASATSAGYGAPTRRANAASAAPPSSIATTISKTSIAPQDLPVTRPSPPTVHPRHLPPAASRPRKSGRGVVRLARHLNHRPAEPRAREEPLRRLVPLGGEEHHARHAARPQERQRGFEEEASDAPAAMLRVNNHVMQNSRRPAQRHVVVPLDGGVRVADHVPVIIGDEDGLLRVFELRAHEGRIGRRSPWPRGQEALWVEVVMLLDEERAEASDAREVGRRRAPDDGPGLGVRWHHTRLTFLSRISGRPADAGVRGIGRP